METILSGIYFCAYSEEENNFWQRKCFCCSIKKPPVGWLIHIFAHQKALNYGDKLGKSCQEDP